MGVIVDMLFGIVTALLATVLKPLCGSGSELVFFNSSILSNRYVIREQPNGWNAGLSPSSMREIPAPAGDLMKNLW